MNKKEIKIYLVTMVVLSYIIGVTVYLFKYNKNFKQNVLDRGLILESITKDEVIEDEAYVNVNLMKTWFGQDRWCLVSSEEQIDINDENFEKVHSNNCRVKIKKDAKYLYIKDAYGNVSKYLITDHINTIVSLNVSVDNTLILVGDKVKIDTNIITIGNPNETINYKSSNEKVAKVENGIIKGIKDGETTIKVYDNYGNSASVEITVTSLVTKPRINNNKKFLSANTYTSKQAAMLDNILFYRVEKAGLKTRAGVVAAARFLVLEFKYKVPYFLENGRLFDNGIADYIDGEGRYYHKGLYLSKDKYKTIKRSTTTPKYWGENLIEYSNDNRIMKNGLDCSGFVVWSIVNGGFDPGDRGAGPNSGDEDIIDLGKSQKITMDLLKSGNVKAGDLIAFPGHVGIIIGVEDGYITVADTLYYEKGAVATRFSFSDLVNKSGFTNIYDMSDYYKEDGNYTPMWS